MKVTIETIPHEDQRYPTVGDWVWNGDDLSIYVSEMGNWRYEMMVGEHEFFEAMVCRHLGIRQEDVDEFDRRFEANRVDGDEREPGDEPHAPYYWPHQFGTCIERLFGIELGVNWKIYEQTVNDL